MSRDLDQFDDNDPALLAAAVGEVRKVKTEAAAPLRQKPVPQARQFHADEAQALRQSQRGEATALAGDSGAYRRPEVPFKVLRRLKRGLYAVQDDIDLHGMTVPVAESSLRRFLRQARDEGARCVLVVHGKGLKSAAGQSVLRPLVERMLSHRRDVLAFCNAPAARGGSGALLVLLAQRRAGEQAGAADE
ncbi:Smr/MutS family protein [Pseudomarimonas arenosa]|uniref:Smr/MutS family protein n=1 Tax=Pseudomarimonas arenosa TaxID=2774145 RepID=A0AAW3ZGU5_9GAMM|nr:Smr/MutS family protein [Pseudomarimonas arenosa]MBD8524779.1 Smr/MutS family protein [Pseudomarimonas arenosa]